MPPNKHVRLSATLAATLSRRRALTKLDRAAGSCLRGREAEQPNTAATTTKEESKPSLLIDSCAYVDCGKHVFVCALSLSNKDAEILQAVKITTYLGN